MAITLSASSCPAPVVPGAVVYQGNSGTAPPASEEFSTGSFTGVAAQLNRNSKGADMAQRYGSGGYAIGSGLALSAGTGLVCNIAQGQAVMDGLVELYAASTVVVTGSATNWIWLKQDGTIVAQTTTAKPTGNCVCLGAAVTDGSGVTSIETSGVVYFRGGQMWRETADAGAPGDSPDSTLRLWTKTVGGLFFWDGVAHRPLITGAVASVTASATLGADVQAALFDATSAGITATLPTAAAMSGRRLALKKIDASTNTVVIDGASAETIDGATTKTLTAQYDAVEILSNGSAWHILNEV
jgi:hypothetical protein